MIAIKIDIPEGYKLKTEGLSTIGDLFIPCILDMREHNRVWNKIDEDSCDKLASAFSMLITPK